MSFNPAFRIVLIILVAVLATGASAEPSCNDEDLRALSVLRKLLQSDHITRFAARALVQTAVGSQQIVVTRGRPDTGTTYSVEIPDHSSDCDNLSHSLLASPSHACGVAQWYKFRMEQQALGADTVTVITALPKDVYRHGYQLVIDEKNNIVLRSTTFNGTNALENVELRALSLAAEDVPSQVSTPERMLRNTGNLAEDSPRGQADWRLGWAPAGFQQASVDRSEIADAQTYTDGLSPFSIFVEHPKGEIRIGEGMVNRGATLAYTRGLRVNQKSILVSVVGEIPINTARMLVEGVEWDNNVQ
jgi:sigma-E factor negative regulatory protein RseB